MTVSYSPYENQPAVIDLGSHTLRFGYSGEAKPLRVFPSILGIASTQDLLKKEQMNSYSNPNILFPLNPMEKKDHLDLIYYTQPNVNITESGVTKTQVYSYSIMEKILEATMGAKILNDSLSDHPILFTEPNRKDTQYRGNVLETLFESFQVPSALLCKTAPLMCYAVARTSGVVLDIGASGCDTCFVSEGYVLPKSIIETAVGGDFLDQLIMNNILKQNYSLQPFFASRNIQNESQKSPSNLLKKTLGNLIPTPFISPSYEQWGKQYVCTSIKENLSQFPPQNSESSLFLPDGKRVDPKHLSELNQFIPEVLFTPEVTHSYNLPISCYYQNPFALSVVNFTSKETKSNALLKKTNTLSMKPPPPSSFLSNQLHTHPMTDISNFLKDFKGITHQIYNSLEAIERTNTLNTLSDALVVGGGSTLFPGFLERLKQDLELKSHLHPLPNTLNICASSLLQERQYCAWIGGSIISCLGSFPQFCISSEEYNELGAINAAEKKCP